MIKILQTLLPNFLIEFARSLDILGKFKNLVSQYNLVYAQNHTIEIFEDSQSSPLAIDKIYEQETTLFSRKYLNPGDCVYDIGANIGYFTLEFARLVGEKGKIHTFEPHPKIFKVLQRNIKRNHYSNVTSHNAACGEITEIKKLYFSTENEGNHKIIENDKSEGSTDVQVVQLANFVIKDIPRFIKIDIEGAELLALKGLGDKIMRNQNIDFIIEYHPYEMSFFDIQGHELISFFENYGYKFRNLNSHDYPIIEKSDILTNYRKENYGITNLFCSKSVY
jgi:FkbM family methyltransferase